VGSYLANRRASISDARYQNLQGIRGRTSGIRNGSLPSSRSSQAFASIELVADRLIDLADRSALTPDVMGPLFGEGARPLSTVDAKGLVWDEVQRLESLRAGLAALKLAAGHEVDFAYYAERYGIDTAKAMEGDDAADPKLERLKDDALERLAKEKREKARLDKEKGNGKSGDRTGTRSRNGNAKKKRPARRFDSASRGPATQGTAPQPPPAPAAQPAPDFSRPPPKQSPYCYICMARDHLAPACPRRGKRS